MNKLKTLLFVKKGAASFTFFGYFRIRTNRLSAVGSLGAFLGHICWTNLDGIFFWCIFRLYTADTAFAFFDSWNGKVEAEVGMAVQKGTVQRAKASGIGSLSNSQGWKRDFFVLFLGYDVPNCFFFGSRVFIEAWPSWEVYSIRLDFLDACRHLQFHEDVAFRTVSLSGIGELVHITCKMFCKWKCWANLLILLMGFIKTLILEELWLQAAPQQCLVGAAHVRWPKFLRTVFNAQPLGDLSNLQHGSIAAWHDFQQPWDLRLELHHFFKTSKQKRPKTLRAVEKETKRF